MKLSHLFIFCLGMISSALAVAANVAEGAKERGFNACISDLSDTAKGLELGNSTGDYAHWYKDNPNNHQYVTIIGNKYSDGQSVAIMGSAPNKEGKCDGFSAHVFTHELDCAEYRETALKDWKYVGSLAGMLVLENKGGLGKVLLPGQNGGCVSMTFDVFFNMQPN